MDLPDLEVHATAVRIPVHTGHSESVYVELEREATLEEVTGGSRDAPGVTFSGDATISRRRWSTPGIRGYYVGRLRVSGRVVEYWCVSDNLLKGAATNAVQIAESLLGAYARA